MTAEVLYTPSVALVGVVLFVGVAAYVDVQTRRVPNWLVLSGILVAIGYRAIFDKSGALFALAGLMIGVAAFMPLYGMRLMGAGDVKLMGMVGAFLGARGAINAILLTLVAGGILAIFIAVRKRMVPELANNLAVLIGELKIPSAGLGRWAGKLPVPSVGDMPYAVAIAIGTIVQIILMQNDFTIF